MKSCKPCKSFTHNAHKAVKFFQSENMWLIQVDLSHAPKERSSDPDLLVVMNHIFSHQEFNLSGKIIHPGTAHSIYFQFIR
jgi:hypothetical protein